MPLSLSVLSSPYVINLDRRPDRLIAVNDEFKQIGITSFIKVQAIDGHGYKDMLRLDGQRVKANEVACAKSHQIVCKLAKDEHKEFYTVFEDDVKFHPRFNDIAPGFFKGIPEYWEIIYLGCSHKEPPSRFHSVAARVTKAFTTHAMIINKSIYDDLIVLWDGSEIADIALVHIQKRGHCYCPIPQLAIQQEGYSDVLNRDVNYCTEFSWHV